ncbi:hypothetical protein [Paenibacillus methanolicus]|uniref:hypothetical protein n=1 Tax=Paenibacillus methanolicus TaxID=582686 RepID=UPI0011E767E7|nr:hypothetical protein [Paenibacillus methanolicus]
MLKKIIKKTIIIYAILGFLIGLGMFGYSLYDDKYVFHFGEKQLNGVVAGVIAVPFLTIIMAIVGFFHSLMFWFPLSFIYKKLRRGNGGSLN